MIKNLERVGWGEWSISTKVFSILLLNFTIFLLNYVWLVSGKMTVATEMLGQINEKKQYIQQQYQNIKKLPILKDQIGTMASIYKTQLLKYSEDINANQLVNKITNLAKINKIVLIKISPSSLQDGEQKNLIMINLTAKATNLNFVKFLYELTKSSCLFLIKSYSLSKNLDNGFWAINLSLEFLSTK